MKISFKQKKKNFQLSKKFDEKNCTTSILDVDNDLIKFDSDLNLEIILNLVCKYNLGKR